MATAILHIGLEKTGTSSLQEFLQLNREQLLLREGIWIPDFLGRGSQWPLAVIAYADARSDDLTAPLGNAQTRLCRIEELRQQIIASVQKNPARVHCFSSEHLSSRLTSVEEITRLRDFLSPLFDDITILLYLREPIRLAISRQSTYVKMGLGPFQLPTPAARGRVQFPNHHRTLAVSFCRLSSGQAVRSIPTIIRSDQRLL